MLVFPYGKGSTDGSFAICQMGALGSARYHDDSGYDGNYSASGQIGTEPS